MTPPRGVVDQLVNARREPDAIAWTRGGRLVTANEEDGALAIFQGRSICALIR